jgi:electron transport complex protein RnfG
MSTEVKTKEKVDMDPMYIIKLTVTLFVTCVIVAALLGLVDNVTREKIAAINWENTVAAMKAVVADPDATTFSDALENTEAMSAAALAGGGTLDSVYEVQVGGASAGYAIKVVASGSQGNIEMMVGVDGEGAVTGVSIVDNAETAGIGSKVMENQNGVLDQFIGRGAPRTARWPWAPMWTPSPAPRCPARASPPASTPRWPWPAPSAEKGGATYESQKTVYGRPAVSEPGSGAGAGHVLHHGHHHLVLQRPGHGRGRADHPDAFQHHHLPDSQNRA